MSYNQYETQENINRIIDEEIAAIDEKMQKIRLDREKSVKIRGLAMGAITACALFTMSDFMGITTSAHSEPVVRMFIVIVLTHLSTKYKLINEFRTSYLVLLEDIKENLENGKMNPIIKKHERK